MPWGQSSGRHSISTGTRTTICGQSQEPYVVGRFSVSLGSDRLQLRRKRKITMKAVCSKLLGWNIEKFVLETLCLSLCLHVDCGRRSDVHVPSQDCSCAKQTHMPKYCPPQTHPSPRKDGAPRCILKLVLVQSRCTCLSIAHFRFREDWDNWSCKSQDQRSQKGRSWGGVAYIYIYKSSN